jgi:uncharacterized membrane protein (UPF0127 family)
VRGVRGAARGTFGLDLSLIRDNILSILNQLIFMKRIIALFVLLTVILSGCSLFDVIGNKKIVLDTAKEKVNLTVEVQDTAAEREQGLMEREKLEDGKGMWFVFEQEKNLYFWMKNMKISIDMLFLNQNKEVVKIYENLKPCEADPCVSYPSGKPAMYVLEVPAGFVQLHEVKLGDKVE